MSKVNRAAADISLFAAMLRSDFRAFVSKSFKEFHQREPFRRSTHIDLLCAVLTQVDLGVITRQIFNLPPRCLKSFIITVCFSAWILGRRPATKIMIISHDQKLVEKLAYQVRKIMRSRWYGQIFPGVRLRRDRSELSNFETTEGGGVFSSSIGAGVTGHGADIIIVDDPLDAKDATSRVEREKVNELFDSKIRSRLNNPATGIILIVAQRLHPQDLSGYLIARKTFNLLGVPLVAPQDERYIAGNFLWDRPTGDRLDPEGFTTQEVERLRREISEETYQTLYQQNPVPSQGAMLKREWFNAVTSIPPLFKERILSFDLAQRPGENSSYSCCLVFATDGTDHCLIGAYRQNAEYVKIRGWALELIEKYSPTAILVEDAASGTALISDIGQQVKYLVACRPKGSKQERILEHYASLSAGRMSVLREAPGLSQFLDEMVQFPDGKYNDQVDAVSQFLDWIGDPARRRHAPAVARSEPSTSPPTNRLGYVMGKRWRPHEQRNPKKPRGRW